MKQNKEKIGTKENPNSIETVTLDILQSETSDQKRWLSFQDIVDNFQNKAFLVNYWNKLNEFEKDLFQALNILETNGKIEKKTIGQESYFSSTS
jgi:CRISPR/Cas system CSM-associated protein Csm4 (group 5 of RAMP superfamily)